VIWCSVGKAELHNEVTNCALHQNIRVMASKMKRLWETWLARERWKIVRNYTHKNERWKDFKDI